MTAQPPAKVPIVDAQTDARRIKIGDLGRQLPIAAPGQHPEPDRALVFVGAAAIHRKPGIVMMAGHQAAAF